MKDFNYYAPTQVVFGRESEEPEFDAWCDGIIEKIERIKELKRI